MEYNLILITTPKRMLLFEYFNSKIYSRYLLSTNNEEVGVQSDGGSIIVK